MDLEEFLGHKTSTPGGYAKNVRWRDRKPAKLDTWLHTQGKIVALWKHGWKRLVQRKVDGVDVLQIWAGDFNCHEHESVLKEQYRRLPDGRRKLPPTTCPMCLVMEYMREQVALKRLDWTAPAFEFKGSDSTEIITVGGMLGLFDGDKLTPKQLQELRDAGIRRDEAWKEATKAKCNYVFQVVDNDNPGDGVQVAVETTALGDAVKAAIAGQIEALGAVEGNPLRTPYAIRWKYDANAAQFGDKYSALVMPKLQLTQDVRELIFDTPAPDITETIAKGNAEALLAVMQKTARVQLPLEQLFAPALGETRPAMQVQVPAQVNAPSARRARAVEPRADEKQPPAYPPGTVLLPCDACGKQMADTDPVCWNCGAEYEVEGTTVPAPPTTATEPGDVGSDDVPF